MASPQLPGTYKALKVIDKQKVKEIKTRLEKVKLIDTNQKITRTKNGEFLIPVLLEGELPPDLQSCEIVTIEVVKKNEAPSVSAELKTVIKEILETHAFSMPENVNNEILIREAPTRYLVYPPLLLFSPGAFTGSKAWSAFLQDASSAEIFYKDLLSRLSSPQNSPQLTHAAENAPIPDKTDILRLPSKLLPLHPGRAAFEDTTGEGDGFWCTAIQNGIKQTWAPMHTMFSRGNIKEKARILGLATDYYKAVGVLTTAVDLYAGIGYFTFSYAASGGFKSVLCWELNPWSTRGLVKGAALNKWKAIEVGTGEHASLERAHIAVPSDVTTTGTKAAKTTKISPLIVVFNEDNTRAFDRIKTACTTDKPCISHINMGLLPHAHLAFPVAIQISLFSALPKVYLHVHENVAADAFDQWITDTRCALQALAKTESNIQFLHLEKIKTYAPGVWHVCGDFLVQKT